MIELKSVLGIEDEHFSKDGLTEAISFYSSCMLWMMAKGLVASGVKLMSIVNTS